MLSSQWYLYSRPLPAQAGTWCLPSSKDKRDTYRGTPQEGEWIEMCAFSLTSVLASYVFLFVWVVFLIWEISFWPASSLEVTTYLSPTWIQKLLEFSASPNSITVEFFPSIMAPYISLLWHGAVHDQIAFSLLTLTHASRLKYQKSSAASGEKARPYKMLSGEQTQALCSCTLSLLL